MGFGNLTRADNGQRDPQVAARQAIELNLSHLHGQP
jgi:hypothetical protein